MFGRAPRSLAHRVAVVTGAGSGIGRGVALALATRGCHLALADRDLARLEDTARMVRALPTAVRCSLHQLDVADRDAVARFPDAVLGAHAGVDVLCNVAGVGLAGTYGQVSDDDIAAVMAVNFWGVAWMTRAFLPLLQRSEDAALVNVSSVFGLIAPAGNIGYAASKFAVRGFTEGLRHELAGSRVQVTVVHPGGVRTNIANDAIVPAGVSAEELERKVRFTNKRLRMPPERAGEIIVRGVERRKARILVGWDAVAISLLARLMPVRYWRVMQGWIRD